MAVKTDNSTGKRNKGGRPRKEIKKDQFLGVKCSLVERKVIENKARQVGVSVSEYLRKLGLSGKIDMKLKIVSKEILLFTATLNHLAANLNQIAKKRNSNDQLNALERAQLEQLSKVNKQLAQDIKNCLNDR
ncbi:mobilization protein [Sediminibacterium roseum]|uniref:Mobilization protein n=1 Tax=Sediminibacterium roseum TaxID=1978412 RepID=A0ABW9ZRP6_9BACT|nr:mobilization protein [Sediminibacterium roseum]NCI49786.1 mobilization protein [Sediminibacterium roseum]